MCHRICLLSLAVLLLITSPAAAMTITMNPLPPPPGDLILSFDVEVDLGCYLCSHGTAAVVDLGQTFRLRSPVTLEKITLKARALTEQTPGELVTLIFGTFSDPDDDSMNELLAAETRSLPLTLPVGEVRYLTFDVADIGLEAGQQYGFYLGFTGGEHVKDARLELLHVGEDAYLDGLAVETAGTATWPLSYDLVFYLHITPRIFADGFESGDMSMWSAATP